MYSDDKKVLQACYNFVMQLALGYQPNIPKLSTIWGSTNKDDELIDRTIASAFQQQYESARDLLNSLGVEVKCQGS